MTWGTAGAAKKKVVSVIKIDEWLDGFEIHERIPSSPTILYYTLRYGEYLNLLQNSISIFRAWAEYCLNFKSRGCSDDKFVMISELSDQKLWLYELWLFYPPSHKIKTDPNESAFIVLNHHHAAKKLKKRKSAQWLIVLRWRGGRRESMLICACDARVCTIKYFVISAKNMCVII